MCRSRSRLCVTLTDIQDSENVNKVNDYIELSREGLKLAAAILPYCRLSVCEIQIFFMYWNMIGEVGLHAPTRQLCQPYDTKCQ